MNFHTCFIFYTFLNVFVLKGKFKLNLADEKFIAYTIFCGFLYSDFCNFCIHIGKKKKVVHFCQQDLNERQKQEKNLSVVQIKICQKDKRVVVIF